MTRKKNTKKNLKNVDVDSQLHSPIGRTVETNNPFLVNTTPPVPEDDISAMGPMPGQLYFGSHEATPTHQPVRGPFLVSGTGLSGIVPSALTSLPSAYASRRTTAAPPRRSLWNTKSKLLISQRVILIPLLRIALLEKTPLILLRQYRIQVFIRNLLKNSINLHRRP